MNAIERERIEILSELARIKPMRRGSITLQTVAAVGSDGRPRQRGPYPIYTYKQAGKTVSRRLTRPESVAACREHVEQGRRFRELTERLMRLGEQLSDQVLSDAALKKTPKPKSKRVSKSTASSRP